MPTHQQIYTATISNVSLRTRESRIVADLLLREADAEAWNRTIRDDNALSARTPESARQVSGELRRRLEPMGAGLWEMVRDGSLEQSTQATLAATVKRSRLLGDFMDITLREQRVILAERLEYHMWTSFIEGCRGRDPEMPEWSDATIARLRSAVFSILAEAGYLSDTRRLLLQNVFPFGQLIEYLRSRDERYVIRCLEVAE